MEAAWQLRQLDGYVGRQIHERYARVCQRIREPLIEGGSGMDAGFLRVCAVGRSSARPHLRQALHADGGGGLAGPLPNARPNATSISWPTQNPMRTQKTTPNSMHAVGTRTKR